MELGFLQPIQSFNSFESFDEFPLYSTLSLKSHLQKILETVLAELDADLVDVANLIHADMYLCLLNIVLLGFHSLKRLDDLGNASVIHIMVQAFLHVLFIGAIGRVFFSCFQSVGKDHPNKLYFW
jgi:hypothetical protein